MSVFSFHNFRSLTSVSKKWYIETMLTFPYSYNWQNLTTKLMEKKTRSIRQSMDPQCVVWYVVCCLIFAPTQKSYIICFSLIKHFPNDYKRYSSHLQVLILHRVTPVKVLSDSCKSFPTINKRFWLASIPGLI